jgi:hypothetical protein
MQPFTTDMSDIVALKRTREYVEQSAEGHAIDKKS